MVPTARHLIPCPADAHLWAGDSPFEQLLCKHLHILILLCLVCGKPTARAGQAGRILGGKLALPDTFPWQVLLNVNGRGGGMVIGDRWVMTAAHNLVQNDQNVVEKDQVIVSGGVELYPIDSIYRVPLVWIPISTLINFQSYFGFQVRGGHIDVNELINRAAQSVASVHVHPGYNNPHFINYDNDIALIRLQNRITFNSSIMPICLPPEGATYEDGLMG